jgi:hypothetical protein
MRIPVKTGELALDQFSALEADGFNRRSGLTVLAGDFVVTTTFNGVVSAVPVTIEEIGTTGRYTVEFTPPADGLYDLEVLVVFSKDIWGAQYQAGAGSIDGVQEQVDKIDSAPTKGMGSVTTGSLMDRFGNKDGAKTFNQGTDSLEALRDRSG